MKVGIIGYGSMGKMILEKLSETQTVAKENLYIANRTYSKIEALKKEYKVCQSSAELAAETDVIFICAGPGDIKNILEDIKPAVSEKALLVSLNGSVTFEILEKVLPHKYAKVIPGLTAEINRSQTLVCYNGEITKADKATLISLMECMGDVIELPEKEMGIGSELVSCMPGFIAAMFDVISKSAKPHTTLPESQIIQMLLKTLVGTGELMLEKGMSFEEVVHRVATKGGITEVGAQIIYAQMPEVADELFHKTMERRRETAERAKERFGV